MNATLPHHTPIALRSWPSDEGKKPEALTTLISRINSERGGFRNLSEEGLRQSIAEAESGIDNKDENVSDNEEDEGDRDSDQIKAFKKAQEELGPELQNARQAANIALDFVSLLLSKDLPKASDTIQPYLKENVGAETLAADKISVSRSTGVQRQANKHVAKGILIQSLSKAAGSLLASASKLEKSIESETRYWEQVLAIDTNGWAMCRLSQEKNTLGVRYGFMEAIPAFKNRSLAALRRNADGKVTLDQGVVSTEPQYLRVRIEKNGLEAGESSMPEAIPEDASIELHIQQARNSIFAEELWQEVNRETRALRQYRVKSKSSTITCPLPPDRTVIFDLVPLSAAIPARRPDDSIAEAISLALHLFLCYAHRQSHRRRAQPPPPISSSKRLNPAFNLIRPLIARLLNETNLSSLNALLKPLVSTLNSTYLPFESAYTINTSAPPINVEAIPAMAERTVITLTDRLESISTVTLVPDTILRITSRTSMFPYTSTFHYVSVSPEDSPLQQICKTPPLSNLESLREFILYATGCAIACHFVDPSIHEGEEDIGLESQGRKGWVRTAQPNILRKSFGKLGRSKQMSFDVKSDVERKQVRLIVRWEWMGRYFLKGSEKEKRLFGGEGVYEWTGKAGQDADSAEVIKSLLDVVEKAGTTDLILADLESE